MKKESIMGSTVYDPPQLKSTKIKSQCPKLWVGMLEHNALNTQNRIHTNTRYIHGWFLPPQILPKLTSSIVHDVDGILGNKPYSKKDYRS